MLFDSVRDRAYGTAAANDRTWPLRGVPCAAALMERAGRRHALISVPLNFILSHRVLGVEPTQYRKTLYDYSVHDSVVLYRRINLPRSLSA